MAHSGQTRQPNLLFVISATGLFLFGLGVLGVAVRDRAMVNRIPVGAEELWQTGYGNLLTTQLEPESRQQVVVTAGDLQPGDQIFPEFIELRPASWVVANFPDFKIPGVEPTPEARLVEGVFESLNDVVGSYALIGIPAGTPLVPELLSRSNPFRNRADELRPDRITVAAPPEPSLWPLLNAGDRVDVFVIVGKSTIRQTIRDCRVVGVNAIVTVDSGLLSKSEQARASALEEAAHRKKLIIEAERAKSGQPAPDAADATAEQPGEATDPAAAETAGESGDTPGQTTAEEPPKVPEGSILLDRPKYNGQTITLQVSRQEAMTLAMANNLPGVWIDLALHPRP